MMHQMHHLFSKYTRLSTIVNCIFLVSAVAYFIFMMLTVANTQHVAFNLEPYPDGIYYLSTARSIASRQGFTFDSKLAYRPEITYVYPLILSLGMLFGSVTTSMLVVNTLSSLAGLYMLWLLLRPRTPIIQLAGLLFFLSHALFWWLPTLPLSENLVWPLVLAGTYNLSAYFRSRHKKYLLFTFFLGCLISSVKFSAIPIGVVLSATALWQFARGKRTITLALSSLIFLGFSYVAFSKKIHDFVRLLRTAEGDYFSLAHVIPNSATYGKILLGLPTHFLWQNVYLAFPIVTLLLCVYYFYRHRHEPWLQSSLALVLAHFPLVLLFYDSDVRYILSIIPLLVVFVTYACDDLLHSLQMRSGRGIGIGLLGVVVILNLMAQGQLFRLLLSQTIGRNSRAWQFESVVHAAQALPQSAKQNNLLTAVPPQLFEYYTPNSSIHILPISAHQEFINKHINVWHNSMIDHQSPIDVARQLILDDQDVFITNAYITHSHQVTADFERYKQDFDMELVASGCQHACDIYKLSNKTKSDILK